MSTASPRGEKQSPRRTGRIRAWWTGTVAARLCKQTRTVPGSCWAGGGEERHAIDCPRRSAFLNRSQAKPGASGRASSRSSPWTSVEAR